MADGIPVKKRWKIDFSSKCTKNVVSFMKTPEAREEALDENEALTEELTEAYDAGEEREEDSLIAHRDNDSSFMPEEDSEEEVASQEIAENSAARLEEPAIEREEEPEEDPSEPPLIRSMTTREPEPELKFDITRIPVQTDGDSLPTTVTVVKAALKPKPKPKKKVMVTIQTYNSESEEEPVKMRPQRRSKPSMMDLRDQHRVFNTTSFMKEMRYDYGAAAAAAPDASPPLITAPVTAAEPVAPRAVTSSSDDTEDGLPLSQYVPKKPTPPEKTEKASFDDKILKKVKKKKLKKKKKDPHEPQKPVSAYALFFREVQSSIKAEHPDASFGEISKIVANQWDALEEGRKAIYKKKTETAKKDYLKKLAAYRANSISSEVPTAAPVSAPDRSPPGFAPASVSGPQLYEATRRPEPAVPPPGEYEPSILSTKPGICVNDGCTNLAIEDARWDREYCSTECVVQHCREAFQSWVLHRQECAIEPQAAMSF